MIISNEIEDELLSFENNLTKKGIPKSVGSPFLWNLKNQIIVFVVIK